MSSKNTIDYNIHIPKKEVNTFLLLIPSIVFVLTLLLYTIGVVISRQAPVADSITTSNVR